MGTVIFDFDSTIVSCESLEELLRQQHTNNQELLEEAQKITLQAMEGKIPFKDALRIRLEMSIPSLDKIVDFGKNLKDELTSGIDLLIKELKTQNIDVWVISGGLIEVITPLCLDIGIQEDHIRGVRLKWSSEGQYVGIDEDDKFSISKCEGARDISKSWDSPKIVVGDGMTDYALYSEGFVDSFIAFTQHCRRDSVIKTGAPEAKNVYELKRLLNLSSV